MEIWKDILEADNFYQVSSLGRLRRKLPNNKTRLKVVSKYPNGYLQFDMSVNSKRVSGIAHRFVAKYFIPNPNNYKVVNHINGIKHDNRVENLEWCTYSENVIHARDVLGVKYGKDQNGENNTNSTLTKEQVIKIRILHKEGMSQSKLAVKFNMKEPAIWKIVNNYTWKKYKNDKFK